MTLIMSNGSLVVYGFYDLQCGDVAGGGVRKYEFYRDVEERCDWDECSREDMVQGHLDLPNQLNILYVQPYLFRLLLNPGW